MKSLSSFGSMGLRGMGLYGSRSSINGNADPRLMNIVGNITPKFFRTFAQYVKTQEDRINKSIINIKGDIETLEGQEQECKAVLNHKERLLEVLQNPAAKLAAYDARTAIPNNPTISQDTKDFFAKIIENIDGTLNGQMLNKHLITILDPTHDKQLNSNYNLQITREKHNLSTIEKELQDLNSFNKEYRKEVMNKLKPFSRGTSSRGYFSSTLFRGINRFS